MKYRIVLLSCITYLLVACAATDVKPFRHAGETGNLTSDEKRVWFGAKRFDTAINNVGAIYNDKKATDYLQSIMDRLYPEFQGKIKVRIVKMPTLNAFALPNGSIYMHIGILSRMDNEAQLASVLAHEGAHFVLRHGYRDRTYLKNTAALTHFLALTGVPGLFSAFLASSSMAGYSRDLEREADKMAFERMRATGYDTKHGSAVFKHLAKEAKALDAEHSVFYASHPKLQERIESFEELHKKSGIVSGDVNEQGYLEQTHGIRLDTMKADLSMDRFKSMILVLKLENSKKKFGLYGNYYLGEAYRRRGKKGDADKAADSYRKAIELAPDYAPSYKGLGIYYMKKGEMDEAKKNFLKYLELAGNESDGYVKAYLKQILERGS